MPQEPVIIGDAYYWVVTGDSSTCLSSLRDGSINCCVTSPPYFGLRSYLDENDPLKCREIGRADDVDRYIESLVVVFREVKRVLRDDGTLWLNLGDSYGKDKNRLVVPARVALALQLDGWILRDEIVWHKPRATHAPVKDRTVASHEMLYLFAKSTKYYFDYMAIEEPSKYPGLKRKRGKAFKNHGAAKAYILSGASKPDTGNGAADAEVMTVRDTRRKRSVWSVSPSPYKQAHYATFPPDLIEPCVLAGCLTSGIVLDPFGGSGTTAGVAVRSGRNAVLFDLDHRNEALVHERVATIVGRKI